MSNQHALWVHKVALLSYSPQIVMRELRNIQD